MVSHAMNVSKTERHHVRPAERNKLLCIGQLLLLPLLLLPEVGLLICSLLFSERVSGEANFEKMRKTMHKRREAIWEGWRAFT